MMKSINKVADQDARLLKLSLLLTNAPQNTKDAIERDMRIAVQMIPYGNSELPGVKQLRG